MLLLIDPKVYLQKIAPSNPCSRRNLSEFTPYGIGFVKAEDVFDSNSSSRKVCIIDSGYDKSHEDLPDDPNIVTGKSLVDGDEAWYIDEIQHGTHVAGTIAVFGGNDDGSTATDLPLGANDGRDDKYGHGLVNAKAAYDAALALQTPSPTVSPAPQPTSKCDIGGKHECSNTSEKGNELSVLI